MTHKEIIDALTHLGFVGGWTVTGTEITLWEHDEPKPSEQQLIEAAQQVALLQEEASQSLAASRTSGLAKLSALGLADDEVRALLG